MKTIVSSKGQIVLPAEIRERDDIQAGQQFEVKRINRGDYRLVRTESAPNVSVLSRYRRWRKVSGYMRYPSVKLSPRRL